MTGSSFVLDRRAWKGGIGRFLAETAPFLPATQPLMSRWRPTHPLAPAELAARLRRLRGHGPFFSHGYVPPLASPVPAMVTLHDLMYMRGHSAQSRPREAYMNALRPLYRRCATIVTMSDAARDDVAEWLGDGVPVVAVGGGVGPQFCPDDSVAPPQRPVVLYVGSRSPNKNPGGILGGFERSAVAAAESGELWLTGSAADWAPHLEPFGARLDGRIRFLGRVDDADLPGVYRSASVVLIPSIEEGYGLPAMEAMACRVPVVHSTDRALCEVVGDTGVVVDPRDSAAIGAGLDAVLGDPARARDLAARGRARAATMTWQAVADRIVSVIDAHR